MKKNLPGIAFAFLVVSGCGNANDNKAADNKQPGTTKESGHTPNTNAETSGTRIRNNIELNTRDLQVSQAFLIYEDGKLVPESNEASVGQPVRLRLVVEGGWKENNGSVSLVRRSASRPTTACWWSMKKTCLHLLPISVRRMPGSLRSRLPSRKWINYMITFWCRAGYGIRTARAK